MCDWMCHCLTVSLSLTSVNTKQSHETDRKYLVVYQTSTRWTGQRQTGTLYSKEGINVQNLSTHSQVVLNATELYFNLNSWQPSSSLSKVYQSNIWPQRNPIVWRLYDVLINTCGLVANCSTQRVTLVSRSALRVQLQSHGFCLHFLPSHTPIRLLCHVLYQDKYTGRWWARSVDVWKPAEWSGNVCVSYTVHLDATRAVGRGQHIDCWIHASFMRHYSYEAKQLLLSSLSLSLAHFGCFHRFCQLQN